MATTFKKIIKTAFLTGLCSLAVLKATALSAHVYIVIYATHDGKSGHAGIAVDKYEIKVTDCKTCPGGIRYDTARTGELLYFDLWPEKDRFNKDRLNESVQPHYFRLPASSAEPAITVASLIIDGIPHEQGYPCDALLKINTSPAKDYQLVQFLDSLIAENRLFNAWTYNCADFVERGVEYLLGQPIDADEKIAWTSATTPNRLCKAVMNLQGVKVIKDPGKLVNGSFFEERILKQENK